MSETPMLEGTNFFDYVQRRPQNPDHPLSQEELTEYLEWATFPQEVIGIDVNGTLITEEDPDAKNIDEEHVEELELAIAEKRAEGKAVVLISDSPAPQLIKLGKTLGMDEGAIAENGNIIIWQNKLIIVNPLMEIDTISAQISEIAAQLGLHEDDPRIAPEFDGGKPVDPNGQEWAFGANRIASISAFGPPTLIATLGKRLILPANASADCSPNDRFFGIHPGTDFKHSKGRTLGMIAGSGRSVTMIGNAPSDWTDPTTGVRSTFVAGSRMTDDMKANAHYISPFPLVRGVADILRTQA